MYSYNVHEKLLQVLSCVFKVPTRESLVKQSELLVNAKQGPKKGMRRK